jgi:hypothetical protein
VARRPARRLPLPENRYLLVGLPVTGPKRRLRDELRRIEARANELIDISVLALEWVIHNRPLFPVHFIQMGQQTDHADAAVWFTTKTVNSPERVRAVLYAATVSCSLDERRRSTLGISHLIGAHVHAAPSGWLPSSGMLNTVVGAPMADLPYLLHDIALDIILYHSYPNLARLIKHRHLAEGFQNTKREFVSHQPGTNHFGPVSERATYASLASVFHGPQNFDYGGYAKAWDELIEHWAAKQDVPFGELCAAQDLALQIRALPKIGGLLPVNRIVKAAKRFAADSLVLTVVLKRPADIRLRESVAAYCGRSKYSHHMWRLLEQSEWREKTPLVFDPYISTVRLLNIW